MQHNTIDAEAAQRWERKLVFFNDKAPATDEFMQPVRQQHLFKGLRM
jgi:hypothetical protein